MEFIEGKSFLCGGLWRRQESCFVREEGVCRGVYLPDMTEGTWKVTDVLDIWERKIETS